MRRMVFLLMVIAFCSGVRPIARAQEAYPDDLSAWEVLSLRDCLARAVSENLDLQVERLGVPVQREGVAVAQSAFDPVVDASTFAGQRRILTGVVLYTDDTNELDEVGFKTGVRKRFQSGLEGRADWQTLWTDNNSLADSLSPQYQNLLLLNLTQPLLRDFGIPVNTAGIRISEKQVDQAVLTYLDRACQIAEQAELAYLDLSRALGVLRLKEASRELARELAEGNRERLRAGMVSTSEVDQAETAVAGRDEAVIAARQQAEIATNALRDLLSIRSGHPLSGRPIGTEPAAEVSAVFPNHDEALGAALKNRGDIAALRLALEIQDIQLQYLENQRLPRLDLGATLGLNGLAGDDRPVALFGQPASSDLTGGWDDALSRMVTGDGFQWAVDLRVTYPLGNRAADARLSQSRLLRRKGVEQLKRLESGIETQVSNARVILGRSMERVAVAERFQTLAQRTLNNEMTRLNQGLSDTFRILSFQEDLLAARIRKINAVLDFHQGMARLYRAMGENLKRQGIAMEIDPEKIAAR